MPHAPCTRKKGNGANIGVKRGYPDMLLPPTHTHTIRLGNQNSSGDASFCIANGRGGRQKREDIIGFRRLVYYPALIKGTRITNLPVALFLLSTMRGGNAYQKGREIWGSRLCFPAPGKARKSKACEKNRCACTRGNVKT